LDVDNNLDSNEDETIIDTINNSISTVNVQDRQNSFQATRSFFANQGGGLIISPKKYKKDKRKGMEEFPENHDNEQTNYRHNMSKK